MLKEKTLDELINKYYDREMNDLELINFEARMALSKGIRDYCNRETTENFLISNSIKLTKIRLKDRIEKNLEEVLGKINKKPLIYINPIIFESFNKHLRNAFLYIKRYNSKQFNRF